MNVADAKPISNIPFISEKFFEKEKEIWRDSWLMVGREADVSEVGQFVTLDIKVINAPIVVVRDSQREIRAFYNICPHRSSRLFCEKEGNKAAIVCRFHGWTFQLDGKLRGIPEKQLFPNLDKEQCSLRELRVDCWGGFIFINLSSEPRHTLKEYLQGLPSGLEAYLSDANWQWYTGYQKDFAANWKDLMNIQHEGYHASHVHKKTLGVYFKADDSRNVLFDDSPGVCSLLTVLRPLQSEDLQDKMTTVQRLSMKYGTTSNWVDQDTSKATDRIENAVNLHASNRWVFDCYTFFPNLILFVGTDVLSVMRVWPLNAHEADWEWDWYFKDELQNFGNLFNREQGRLATRNALTEDWPVVEWAHENMRTNVFTHSHIANDMEATVRAHYEKLLLHMNIKESELDNEFK